MLYLHGKAAVGLYERRKSRMKTNTKKFFVWESRLVRRTVHVHRVVEPTSDRKKVLKCIHDDIAHWDLNTTRQFVTERCW